MIALLCIVIFGIISAQEDFTPTYDYCDKTLCSQSMHIACNNDLKFDDKCSTDARIVPLEKNEIDVILKAHNKLRDQIAHGGFSGFSPATRMATVVWDDELAYLASLNVRHCSTFHDNCRNTKKFPNAGQNLAYKGYSGKVPRLNAIIESQIRLWFNEYKDLTMESISAYKIEISGKTTMNFAQLVQEKSTHVGCALLIQSRNDWMQHFLACNYAHGNLIGESVYSSGANAASDCKTGTNPAYPSLCSINENYSSVEINTYSDKTKDNVMTTQKPDSSVRNNNNNTSDDETKTNTKQNRPFENFLQQVGKHLDKYNHLNVTVNTFGHERTSIKSVKFDNRSSKKDKLKKKKKKNNERVKKSKRRKDKQLGKEDQQNTNESLQE